jgi:hypothetical protein
VPELPDRAACCPICVRQSSEGRQSAVTPLPVLNGWGGVAEVLPDHEVTSALVIVAHPDDAEFWAGGTIALWSATGCKVTYLLLTDGDAGGFDRRLPRSELPMVRRRNSVTPRRSSVPMTFGSWAGRKAA